MTLILSINYSVEKLTAKFLQFAKQHGVGMRSFTEITSSQHVKEV